MSHQLYWIHLPEHTDITTQGYIGVTKYGVSKRFRQHKSKALNNNKGVLYSAIRKHLDNTQVTLLVVGDKEYIYQLEKQLRPSHRIGWNTSEGGKFNKTTPVKQPRVDYSYKHSSEQYLRFITAMSNKRLPTKPRIGFWLEGRFSQDVAKHMLKLYSNYCNNELLSSTQVTIEFPLIQKHHSKQILKIFDSGYSPHTDRLFLECLSNNNFNPVPYCGAKVDTDVWLMAEHLRVSYFVNNLGVKAVATKTGILSPKLRVMWKQFKSGWIPSEDNIYIKWKESHES